MHASPGTVHAESDHSTDTRSGSLPVSSHRVWFLAVAVAIGSLSGRAQAGDPERACCLDGGGCTNATVADCEAQGGTPSEDANDFCTAPRACCMPEGGCADLDPVCCEAAGGTPDSLNIGCQRDESCCLPDGGCVEWPSRCCQAAGGTPGGILSSCAPAEACCIGGACTEGDPECCAAAGGLSQGADSICEAPQACEFDDGSCEELDMMCCLEEGGIPQGDGSVCEAPEACCMRGGDCANLVAAECEAAGGASRGEETACTEPESCCLGDGTCADMDPLCCAAMGGAAGGPGSACEEPQGCCVPRTGCVDAAPSCCAEMGGTPQGAESACTETQACCLEDGACADLDPLCCREAGGKPRGSGSTCENTPCEGEGCGAGYWKLTEDGPSNAHHECNWAYNQPDDLFGETCASADPTVCFEDAFEDWSLIDVLGPLHQRDGCKPQLCSLGFHTMAALLNAESPDVSYELTAAQVIQMFNDVYPGSAQDYNRLKAEFARLNGACCPLGNCKDGGLNNEPCHRGAKESESESEEDGAAEGPKGSSPRNLALSSGCGAVGMVSLLGMFAGMTAIGRTLRRMPGRKKG